MSKLNLLPVCLFCLISSSTAVYSADQEDIDQHRRIQQTAKMHGVHSQKMIDHMQRMLPLLMSQPAAEEDKAQQVKYYERLTRLSNKVRRTTGSINKFLPNDELDEEEATKFKALGTQLFEESKNAETAAKSDDPAALEAALDRFNQTCIDCHRLFREQ